jgi:AcrR family transcriptional regulator
MPVPFSRLSAIIAEVLSAPIGRFDSAGRRLKLVCAAMDTLVTTGTPVIAMSVVAKAAGVSTATLYRDFADRDALIDACMDWSIPILAQLMTEAAQEPDPRRRLVAMLLTHAEVFADPYLDVILRHHVFNLRQGREFREDVARTGRAMVEQYWLEQLERLRQEGMIGAVDLPVAVNFLLSPMERRTVLSSLLFGVDRGDRPTIEEAAEAAADAFLLWAAPQRD